MPPDTRRKPSAPSAAASACGVGDDLRGVLRERGCAASRNATALPAMTCSSGPPCRPGKIALSMAAPYSSRDEDAAAAGTAQGLVRGEGDDVGVGHRVGVRAAGDEAGDVRGVEHEQRADLVGDRAERLGIDDAGVGGGTGDDHLRPVLERQVADLVVVDALVGRRHAVGDEVVEATGDVDRRRRG